MQHIFLDFRSQIYLAINLQQTGISTKIPKRNARQALVPSIGIIRKPKRPNCAVLAAFKISTSLARTSRIARGMQENLRGFVVLRSGRTHYRTCTCSCRRCQSRACGTPPQVILPATRWQISFLSTNHSRSTSSVRVNSRLFRRQFGCTTHRTLFRWFYARWLHAQTIDARMHCPRTIQPWTNHQLRRETEFDQIYLRQGRNSNVLRGLSRTACHLQTNGTVRIARKVSLRQNLVSLTNSEQRIPRGLLENRGSYRGQANYENDKQSRKNISSSRARPQNWSLASWYTPNANAELISQSRQAVRTTKSYKRATSDRQRQNVGQTTSNEGQRQTWNVSKRLVFHSQILHHSSRKRLSSQTKKRQFCSSRHGCAGSYSGQSLPAMPTRMASGRTPRRPTLQPTAQSWQQRRIQNATVPTTPVCSESPLGIIGTVASDTASSAIHVQLVLITIDATNSAQLPTAAETNPYDNGATTTTPTATDAACANGPPSTTTYPTNYQYDALRIDPKPTLFGSLLTVSVNTSRQRRPRESFHTSRFNKETESISRFGGLDSRHRRRKAPLKQASISAANTGLYKYYMGSSNGHRRVGAAQKRAMYRWRTKPRFIWLAPRRYQSRDKCCYLFYAHPRVLNVRVRRDKHANGHNSHTNCHESRSRQIVRDRHQHIVKSDPQTQQRENKLRSNAGRPDYLFHVT